MIGQTVREVLEGKKTEGQVLTCACVDGVTQMGSGASATPPSQR